MRLLPFALGLSFLLTACTAPAFTAAGRADGALGAAAKAGSKAPANRRDAGKLVAKKPASPLPTNVALMFRVLDADADGAVTPAEWPYDEAAISRGATPFATPDKDRDGRVSDAEWTAFGLVRFKDAPFAAADLEDGFVRSDLDADVRLTADEVGLLVRGLAPAVRASLYLDDEPISAWVKAADLNHDFAVDRAELERLLAELMIRRFGDVG